MANTTTTCIVFEPKNGLYNDDFKEDINKYKEKFKSVSGSYELTPLTQPPYSYYCGMRYNHHDFDDYYNSLAGLDNLVLHMSIHNGDPEDDKHLTVSTDSIVEVLTSDQELNNSDEDLDHLRE